MMDTYMYYMVLPELLQALCKLLQEVASGRLGDSPIPSDILAKVAPAAIFQNNVDAIPFLRAAHE